MPRLRQVRAHRRVRRPSRHRPRRYPHPRRRSSERRHLPLFPWLLTVQRTIGAARRRQPRQHQCRRRQHPCHRHCRWHKRGRYRLPTYRKELLSILTSCPHPIWRLAHTWAPMPAPPQRRRRRWGRPRSQAPPRLPALRAGTRRWRDIGRYALGIGRIRRYRRSHRRWRRRRSSCPTAMRDLASHRGRSRLCLPCRHRLRCRLRKLRSSGRAYPLQQARLRHSVTCHQARSRQLPSARCLSR